MLTLAARFALPINRARGVMTRKPLRNALMLAIAAISASLEAPRLAHEPLTTAAASMLDANGAIGDAVETVASNVSGTYLGFDTNIYPGDRAMDAWKQSGEYKWVGYYL